MVYLKAKSTSSITLFFDKRMFDTTMESIEYTSTRLEDRPNHGHWAVIRNAETFELLFGRNPRAEIPVSIKAELSYKI
jgi:hypothetical protein